jgi:hypothetical protein
MNPTLLFLQSPDLEAFRRGIESEGGAFSFMSADMIDLGKAYFLKYPDRAEGRNMEEVRLGYTLVRIAIVEKIIACLPPPRRERYRRLFEDVGRAVEESEALVRDLGADAYIEDYETLAKALVEVKSAIDEIPKGMIKERFVGGISNLFNILYLLNPLRGNPRT